MSDDDEEKPKPSNVVELPPRPDLPSAQLRPSDEEPPEPANIGPEITTKHGGKYCSHRRKFIHPYVRAVSCRDCGCALDVFDTLATWVRAREALTYEERLTRDRVKRTQEELAELKREITNLRAQRRRLTAKDAPPEEAKEELPSRGYMRIFQRRKDPPR